MRNNDSVVIKMDEKQINTTRENGWFSATESLCY